MRASSVWFGAFLLSVTLASEASAGVITRCGASQGHSLYFESYLLPKEKAGWQPDGIAIGNMHLVQDGDQFDIVYRDGFGTRSMRGDAFTITAIPQVDPHSFLLLALNPQTGHVEHFLFMLDQMGKGTVAWGSIRAGGAFPKSSLYQAHCSSP